VTAAWHSPAHEQRAGEKRSREKGVLGRSVGGIPEGQGRVTNIVVAEQYVLTENLRGGNAVHVAAKDSSKPGRDATQDTLTCDPEGLRLDQIAKIELQSERTPDRNHDRRRIRCTGRETRQNGACRLGTDILGVERRPTNHLKCSSDSRESVRESKRFLGAVPAETVEKVDRYLERVLEVFERGQRRRRIVTQNLRQRVLEERGILDEQAGGRHWVHGSQGEP